ncbi:aspartyl-trna synthetase [Moniliophthora roreri]|uniref:Probable aspartate--tRNA ligase, cytoplasmic n=1 Tax=Moniliophthora roreri TaxID=221103 RepID=A0A0W0G9H9_MONRR|nr:aspartyl-trna synthetase [Moniliophthora roreri]
MSSFKTALSKVKSRLSPSSSPSHSKNPSQSSLPNDIQTSSRLSRELERIEQKRDTEKRLVAEENRRKEEFEEAYAADPPEIRARYGNLPLVEAEEKEEENKVTFSLDELLGGESEWEGKQVTFRARIHTHRVVGPKLAFLVLRQQLTTIQAVVQVQDSVVSDTFVRWAERLKHETFIIASGTLSKPATPIQSTTIHSIELHVTALHLIAEPIESVPFTVYADDLSKKPDDTKPIHISDRTRMDSANRIIDLRTPVSQSIFRVSHTISSAFRTHLDSLGFIEIHTPKLQAGATESGSSVFAVKYFGRKAFLAQSPQLGKQMAMSADFGKVYEVGPVFRAENSNTHRHLTEFTGLDLEMTLEQHYHEALRVIDGTLKHIFKTVYERCRREIDIIKSAYPSEDLVWLDETPVLAFSEGIALLRDSGWTDPESGEAPSELDDLGTRDEIRLGQLVKEKYGTDYFILDKFPAGPRPFYAMPDPKDDRLTNTFDIFVRGQEILTGGQRIHDAQFLEDRMAQLGVQVSGALREYCKGFRYGCPPHAGGGIGLERVVMLLLALPDIRHASLFPRDPKSLTPDYSPPTLRHPECDTLHPPWEHTDSDQIPTTNEAINEQMPLEKLIANYGDASNTSWTDERYKIWRHRATGAAIGYVPSHGFAVVVGDPLCDSHQYGEVIHAFLPWIRKEVGKPIWILVSGAVEGVLGGDFGWRCISCVAEDRADPVDNCAKEDSAIAKKIRHAKREGVRVVEFTSGEQVPSELQAKIDRRLEDWLKDRKTKGKQVHLTDVKPWRDMEHRMYFVAVGPAGAGSGSGSGTRTPTKVTLQLGKKNTKDRKKEEETSLLSGVKSNLDGHTPTPSDVLSVTSTGSALSSKWDGQEVHAMVVLTQLAPQKGYQVKWALDFPGAPSGTIEHAVLTALDTAASTGARSVTFGAGARATLEAVHGFSNSNIVLRSMEHLYQTLATELKLMGKSEFRSKMGAVEDPVYICFGKRTMGPRGLRALMGFLTGSGSE